MSTRRTGVVALAGLLTLACPGARADFDGGLASFRAGDFDAALRIWRDCAIAGDAHCQYGMGVLYDEGRGIVADVHEAVVWFERAARQDFTDAQIQLGFLYAVGREGLPQDAVQSYVWFSRAAAAGNPEATAHRDRVGALLTEAERAEAERRSDELSIRYHLQR